MGKLPEEFANCSCEIYEPSCQRREGIDEVVFVIDVKGYSRSQLHVKTEWGKLIIWGERRVGEISLRKVIRLERHWTKEIRPLMFGNGVNGAKLTITIKKPTEGAVWSQLKNVISTLAKKSNPMLKAYGTSAYRVAVLTLLLIQIVVMINCSLQSMPHKAHK